MAKTFRTSEGGESEIRSYIKRSNQLWRYASIAHENQDFDACAINTIHSCISLSDACCLKIEGRRYAGSSHEEAVEFFHNLRHPSDNFQQAVRRLGQIVSGKTTAEYGGRSMTQKDAETIYKNGDRFRSFVFEEILRQYSDI